MQRNRREDEEGQCEEEEEDTDERPQHQQVEEPPQQLHEIYGFPYASTVSSISMSLMTQRQQPLNPTGSASLPHDPPLPQHSSASSKNTFSDPEQLFPNKLFNMLHDAERQGFTEVVSWGEDSHRAFKVHRKREFEQLVLPKYFKMTKYKSFTRQLHNYEFLWVRSGNDKGGYSHPAFDRNDPSCCAEISRRIAQKPQDLATAAGKKRPKSTSNRTPSDEEDYVAAAATSWATRGRSHSRSFSGPPTMPYVHQQLPPSSYQQQEQRQQQLSHEQLPLVNFYRTQGTEYVPAAAAAAYQQMSLTRRNPEMYLEELKLPAPGVSMADAPHPHPLDTLLEPRTIEEMLQDSSTDVRKPAGTTQDDKGNLHKKGK